MNKKSFTFIEFLIVVAIFAIIGVIAFVAVNPIARFQDSRNEKRWTDANKILNAIKVDQVDNGGSFLTSIEKAKPGAKYMITNGSGDNCDALNDYCETNVNTETTSGEFCLDLSGLVKQEYLESLPVSPNGKGDWSKSMTGYTLEKSQDGVITIRACEAEGDPEIWLAR